jgi:hypothetical protein
LLKREQVDWELDEADQLRRVIRAAIITGQSTNNRGEQDETPSAGELSQSG